MERGRVRQWVIGTGAAGMDNVIHINLNEPLAARKVSRGELIQHRALETVREIVFRQVRDARGGLETATRQEDEFTDRRHNAIAIAGGRGTGKTTFRLSLKALLDEDKDEAISKHLEWLPPIDPTLIENKEHIFVTILALMWRSVSPRLDETHPEPLPKKHAWHDAFRLLAEGLQVLEGIGSNTFNEAEWESPQYIMERGINRANSGNALEKRFHEFIKQTLDVLGKHAFVVTLDDIDTQFERGWHVLEVVRRYLTSRQLIVLVLGDLHLYSLLVEREQWSTMAGKMPADRLRGGDISDAVRRLESQYLEKIFKVENRVKLQTLDEVVVDFKVEVTCRKQEDRKQDPIPLPLPNLLLAFCVHALALQDPRDRDNVTHLILRQPVRTVLNLLTGPIDRIHDERAVKRQDIRRMLDLLAETSLVALYRHGVRVDDLRAATADNVLDLAIDFLRAADLWHDGYRLKPEFRDDVLNLALLALGSRLTFFLKESPQLLADYMIRVGITREAGMMKDTKFYTEFVGLGTTKSLPTIARRAIGYLRSEGNGKADLDGPTLGSIATVTHMTVADMDVYAERLRQKASAGKCSHYDVYINSVGKTARPPVLVSTLGSLQKRLKGFGSTLAALPALRLTDAAGHSTSYLSIFPLIAIVSELLDRKFEDEDQEQRLRRWGQVRSFPIYCEPLEYGKVKREPGLVGPTIQQEREATALPQEHETTAHPMMAYLQAWVNWATRTWATEGWAPISSHVLGDIWARFYHSIERVDETPTDEWFAGNLLHRYIVAFLNAVLVEEHLL